MNLYLNGYRLHLVFSPTDMRSGYRTLSAIASSCLQLDIAEGKDCVVFVSAGRTLCKAILKTRKYRRIPMRLSEPYDR